MWIHGGCGTSSECLSFLLAVDDALAAMIYILVVLYHAPVLVISRVAGSYPKAERPICDRGRYSISYLLTIRGELKARSESHRVSLSCRLH